MLSKALFALLPSLALGAIIWDGRVPQSATLEEFDSYSTSKYGAEYVLGEGQKWSSVLNFPSVAQQSLFDAKVDAKPIEVTINDQSIFNPGTAQTGFRRSELMPISNNGSDPTVQGVTTHHVSILANTLKPLNYSHEYQNVFVEAADYTHQIWTLRMGQSFGQSGQKRTIRLTTSTANGANAQVLHEVAFGGSEGWHNYAITTDWSNNRITAYYSNGVAPLRQVVSQRYNNAAGKGVVHFGILKLPTPPAQDVSRSGYQPRGINEAIIYGGLFIETGTPTLS